jgi:microcystin-dependent protein
MAKNRVSEWDVVSDNNLDIKGINISDNMPPSFVNDAMREMMAQIKQWQSGLYDESLTIKGDLDLQGGMTLNGAAGTSGQFLMSQGPGETPQWGSAEIPDAFSPGMIILWSGLTSTVPTGWALCNGTNGTPNLTDRFIIGAGNTYGVNQTGGYKDATLVSHNHTASVGAAGGHSHSVSTSGQSSGYPIQVSEEQIYGSGQNNMGMKFSTDSVGAHTHTVNIGNKGSSATNRNLPPYYALAYIMRK